MEAFMIDDLESALEIQSDVEDLCRQVKYKDLFDIDYKNPATLLYYLYTSKRFLAPTGCLTFVRKEGKIVAISAAEEWESDNDVALIGRRLVYHKSVRKESIHTLYTLPLQVEWCRRKNKKVGVIPINKDRVAIFEGYSRMERGGSEYPGFPYNHLYYGRIKTFYGPYNIKSTPQHIIAYFIDEVYDWEPPPETIWKD